jgi:hypothetical protein
LNQPTNLKGLILATNQPEGQVCRLFGWWPP